MPEYLAPAVYVEEIPSANKPIEGASTSTAAMVGLAQRGPVNWPTLVTSSGAFSRLFGGILDPRVFIDGLDAMPQAALGFFANGGSRLYVTRIVGDAATRASASIWGAAAESSATVTLAARAGAGDQRIALSDGTEAAADASFVLVDGVRSEAVTTIGAAAQTLVLFATPLAGEVADNAAVTEQTIAQGALQADPLDMVRGGGLAFQNPLALPAGTILRLRDTGTPDRTEYVTIAVTDTTEIEQPALLFDHPAGTTEVHVVTLTAGATTQADGASAGGSTSLWVNNAAALGIGDLIAVPTSAATEYRVVTAAPAVATIDAPLALPHSAGAAVQQVSGLIQVHARYPGAWGNALRVRAAPASLLSTTSRLAANAGAQSLALSSTFGLFAGSALIIGTGTAAQLATVTSVNRNSNEVTLAAPLAAGVDAASAVVSREFNLAIDRIENDKVVESELFEGLALHPDHARYALKSIGAFDRAALVAGAAGASELVRLSDLSLTDDGDDVTGADALRQSAPIGGASFTMTGGDDDLANIDDDSFIGITADDPEDRTGIQALENEMAISLVAVPGRTAVAVQNALLEHCEKMRYRFAVIEPPAGAKLNDARAHRQNFDSTRGAIYYPWLNVPDPVGAPGDLIRVPPSGHVMGIIARTDNARGVWKAPANETVRGIVRLDTALTKGEQDILNPVHVNCFRDFRSVNRGLRLWGARTLTSDPEFRYVNVRRLLLFIAQSLDTGLQWAVFEPNAEPLWASVKQSVRNFLVGIWRDGGLEGTTEEEAFFVDVGYDLTMTQGDIDNGRMIVVVGVAPVKPAEFVIVRISQKTREAIS